MSSPACRRKLFSSPGSLLKVNYNTGHPVAYGMKEKGICFFGGGMAFQVGPTKEPQTKEAPGKEPQGKEAQAKEAQAKEAAPANVPEESPIRIVAVYPDEPLLVSGWLLGGEKMQGKAAVLDATVGKGKVVLFGFNVINRAQLYSTMKLLLNSAYYR